MASWKKKVLCNSYLTFLSSRLFSFKIIISFHLKLFIGIYKVFSGNDDKVTVLTTKNWFSGSSLLRFVGFTREQFTGLRIFVNCVYNWKIWHHMPYWCFPAVLLCLWLCSAQRKLMMLMGLDGGVNVGKTQYLQTNFIWRLFQCRIIYDYDYYDSD